MRKRTGSGKIGKILNVLFESPHTNFKHRNEFFFRVD